MTDAIEKPWGVYETTCLLCDLAIVTVVEVEMVDSGEHDPFRVLCGDCEAKAQSWPGANVPALSEDFTRERIEGEGI